MDYGTDICSDWSFNEDGDLKLVSDLDNMEQALTNRLTCDLNSLELFYDDYGCGLSQFFGWRKTDRTLEFVRLELENRILSEPRIEGYTLQVEYGAHGIDVSMELVLNNEYVHRVELTLGDDINV